MLKRVRPFLIDLWRDGYAVVGIIAAPLSIIFTLAKAFDVQALGHLRDVSYAWAFAPLVIWFLVAYVRRRSHSAKIDELTAQLTPKLKCSFDMNDPGCVRPNTKIVAGPNKDVVATWYRIKVEALGTSTLRECRGRLVAIERGSGNLLLGETPTLNFSQGDPLSKTISPGVAEHLDFLVANDTHGAHVAVVPEHLSQAVQWNDLFSLPGDYRIRIAVVSTNSPPASIDLIFRWTLNPRTSEVFMA
ncbi:MAG: hypothetical protein JWR80_3474 [Bradyrhizobium sp.]|nr:hypothetical protein [Bradyrhizobium sp.]